MRIALVIGEYDAVGGGAERWTDRHARLLLARGHKVHLVARRFRGAPDTAIQHVVPSPTSPWRRRLGFARAVERLRAEQTFDIVHDMGDGWSADIFMPHHGTRRGSQEQNLRLISPAARWSRRISQRLLPRYLEFRSLEGKKYERGREGIHIALSNMVAGDMKKYHGVSDERIRVVYNGVDIETFRPCSDLKQRQRTRAGLRVRPGEVLYLLVAHNFRLKGLDATLQALKRLRQDNAPARLLVVGGDSSFRYQRLARSLGCLDAVDFVGDQPDPITYYHAADAFVMPTFYDPCSLVALEALACGLPVITTRHNGVHELMQEGREGFVLDDAKDAEGLIGFMRAMLDADRRRTASLAARALATRHTNERNCDEHIAVYREVVQDRARHAPNPAVQPSGSPMIT